MVSRRFAHAGLTYRRRFSALPHLLERRRMKIGAASVLAKPFDLDELVQAAERALQNRPTV
jgi:hypothetical protein